MANLSASALFNTTAFTLLFSTFAASAAGVTARTPVSFRVVADANTFLDVTGVGFAYAPAGGGNFVPAAGAVDGLFLSQAGVYTYSLSGINRTIAELGTLAAQAATGPAGLEAALAALFADGDSLVSGPGNDEVRAFAGNDGIQAGGGDDSLEGGDGNDFLYGGRFLDPVASGNDSFFGGNGNDGLFGQDGDDTMTGGTGNDTLDGGAGFDSVTFSASDRPVFVDLGGPVAANGFRYLSDDTSLGADAAQYDAFIGIEGARGGGGNDLLLGDGGANLLTGGGGTDGIQGRGGDDTIGSGTGDELLIGGAYNAAAPYTPDTGGADTFIFTDGDGDDLVLDFNPAQDQVRLRDFEVGSVSALLAQPGSGGFTFGGVNFVRLQVDENDSLTLANTTMAQVTPALFGGELVV